MARFDPEISIRNILGDERLKQNQTNTLKKYDRDNIAKGDMPLTRRNSLNCVRQFGIFFDKPFKSASKDDIIDFIVSLEKSKLKTNTMSQYKSQLKKFYKWLYDFDEGYPDIVKKLKTTVSKKDKKRKLPEEMLEYDEIKKLANAAMNPRDRAMILVLYDSATRSDEFLSMKIKDVVLKKEFAKIRVKGKTGERQIPIVNSLPDLQNWLNHHPSKDNPDADVWVALSEKNRGSFTRSINWSYLYALLQRLRKQTGIKKKIYPHLFRHSRLTHLARDGFNEAKLKKFAGWSDESKMAAVYLHLNDTDVEDSILEISGVKSPDRKDEDKKKKEALRPTKCPRCEFVNSAVSKFCSQCSMALSLDVVMEMEEQEQKIDESRVRNLMVKLESFSNKDQERAMELLELLVKR